MQTALSVTNLTKRYGEFLAVDHVSFEIKPGEILGLLGPNGAGKSSTIQMLTGLTHADAGEIVYFGQDFYTHREACLQQMNYASAYNVLQGRLTIRQNLRCFADFYNVPDPTERITTLAKLFEIEDLLETTFWQLSSGQKTRAVLAKSLLNRPKLVLMDEPTASLDPDIVDKMIELIKELQRVEEVSMLYTSHNMDEVARLCDRVAFLAQGKIVAIDTPLELTKKIGTVRLIIGFEGDTKKVHGYLTQHKLHDEDTRQNWLQVSIPEIDVPKVLFGLKEAGMWITDLSINKPSLEDVFLHISREKTI